MHCYCKIINFISFNYKLLYIINLLTFIIISLKITLIIIFNIDRQYKIILYF